MYNTNVCLYVEKIVRRFVIAGAENKEQSVTKKWGLFFVTEVYVSFLIFGLVRKLAVSNTRTKLNKGQRKVVESNWKLFLSLSSRDSFACLTFFHSAFQCIASESKYPIMCIHWLDEENLYMTSLAEKWSHASLSIFGRLRLMSMSESTIMTLDRFALNIISCMYACMHVCLCVCNISRTCGVTNK